MRAETADPPSIFLKVFAGMATDAVDLGTAPKALDEIASFGLEDAFWRLADSEFGYREGSGETPTIRGLLYRIFVTDFCNGIAKEPAPLAHFVIVDRAKAGHASVFASRWRSDMANYGSYDKLSGAVADELRVLEILGPMDADTLADAMTFEAIEKRVIGDLKARIISGGGANMDSVRALMARRRDGHWANPMLAMGSDSIRALVASYRALDAAASFFELQAAFGKDSASPTPPAPSSVTSTRSSNSTSSIVPSCALPIGSSPWAGRCCMSCAIRWRTPIRDGSSGSSRPHGDRCLKAAGCSVPGALRASLINTISSHSASPQRSMAAPSASTS
jgi:hypothetical protein